MVVLVVETTDRVTVNSAPTVFCDRVKIADGEACDVGRQGQNIAVGYQINTGAAVGDFDREFGRSGQAAVQFSGHEHAKF